jgi:hypothetical protein
MLRRRLLSASDLRQHPPDFFFALKFYTRAASGA